MIITKTPFRISFFGGGTDYPEWLTDNDGSILSSTIDKYCYITCRYLPQFFPTHKYRIVYSKIDLCNNVDDIQHPVVREGLKYMNITEGIEVHYDGDLPARSGIGSSSSFTVGFLTALHALKGNIISKEQLAKEAIHIEQNIIKECVGSQDQIATSFGGLQHIRLYNQNEFEVTPVTILAERKLELESHLMLFYTGFLRTKDASTVAQSFVCKLQDNKDQLLRMKEMVDEAMYILHSRQNISEFGKLMHEGWLLKRSLGSQISNESIDNLYNRAINIGITGGKLIGAGQGGFMLFFVEPDLHTKIISEFSDLLHVPFKFDSIGSHVVYYDGK